MGAPPLTNLPRCKCMVDQSTTRVLICFCQTNFLGTRRADGLRAVNVMAILQEHVAILSGGRDRRGGAIVSFPETSRREKVKPDDLRDLLQYLLGVPW